MGDIKRGNRLKFRGYYYGRTGGWGQTGGTKESSVQGGDAREADEVK